LREKINVQTNTQKSTIKINIAFEVKWCGSIIQRISSALLSERLKLKTGEEKIKAIVKDITVYHLIRIINNIMGF
jgi:hypothetical protein